MNLELERDPIRLRRVRSRRFRFTAETGYTRKVVPRVMSVGDLYQKFQPKFEERIIGADFWYDQTTSFGLPLLFADETIDTPAPRCELVNDDSDQGCMPKDAALGQTTKTTVQQIKDTVGSFAIVEDEPTVEMEYVKLTKNEIFSKFVKISDAWSFQRAWESNPTLREGHPVYVDLALEVASCKRKKINPKTCPIVARKIGTWSSLAG